MKVISDISSTFYFYQLFNYKHLNIHYYSLLNHFSVCHFNLISLLRGKVSVGVFAKIFHRMEKIGETNDYVKGGNGRL